MSNEGKHFYDFGPFRLDPTERVLLRQGEMVPLSPKVLEILMVLVRNRGHIVEKEQLLNEIWPDSFVEEGNINVRVSALRKVLGETADGRDYIQTIPRRGYRFAAAIERVSQEPADLVVQRRTVTRIVHEEEEISAGTEPDDASSLPAAQTREAPANSVPTRVTLNAREALQLPAREVRSSPALSAKKLAIGAALAALLAVGGYFSRDILRTRANPQGARIMLGVLPFVDLSGEQGQEYFSDGLTEEMISQLGGLNPSRLGVIARTSVMTYKHSTKSVNQIGRELGVDYIVEGSVRRSGNRVRITAQLIQTSDQTHLWGDSFDRGLGDILKLEEDVSRSIAREIRVQLKPPEQPANANTRPINTEAYEAYLKGRYYFGQRHRGAIEKSIEFYNQAIVKDPNYALAYAGLADSYILLGLFSVRTADVMPKAESAAARALELDGSLAEAHTSLAGVKAMYDWDWRGAEREFKLAMKLNPDYAPAQHWYATLYCAPLGKKQETIEHMERSMKLDPLSPIIATDLGWAYFLAGQTDRAIAQYFKARELDVMFCPVLERLARAYVKKGVYQEALNLNKVNAEFPTDIAAAMQRGYQQAGYRGALQAELEVALKKKESGQPVTAYDLAFVFAELGDENRALEQLEEAYRERYPGLTYMNVDPPFETLRSNARFQSLERRVGLMP
jgi:TolB-like protein/DNA-binding winged helix-turn-helix (wHTH) protein/Flp pilus assembly protein TadD